MMSYRLFWAILAFADPGIDRVSFLDFMPLKWTSNAAMTANIIGVPEFSCVAMRPL